MDFDAVIVGGGTAGAITALNLAPFRRVLLIEREAIPARRIGESLPGIAGRLLSDMGLFETFVADGHLPRHALCGAWGQSSPTVRDALADPDGHGWQLDRAKFEERLRTEALTRGTTMLNSAKLIAVERYSNGWRVRCERKGREFHFTTRLMIDAAGRRSRWLASHGAVRRIHDRLSCAWIRAQEVDLPMGIVHIEAEADGWWYAAPVPNCAGILAFHTDANLPAAHVGRTPSDLLARARRLPMLGSLVATRCWDFGERGYCAAHGAWLDSAAGDT
jgi:2-polyprenyl-6-methoxyphenol hydroxylase-like FAD-dependent oxidoreductase